MKNILLVLYFTFLESDIISGVGFLDILAKGTWPWAQPLDGSISLKFLCWKLG